MTEEGIGQSPEVVGIKGLLPIETAIDDYNFDRQNAVYIEQEANGFESFAQMMKAADRGSQTGDFFAALGKVFGDESGALGKIMEQEARLALNKKKGEEFDWEEVMQKIAINPEGAAHGRVHLLERANDIKEHLEKNNRLNDYLANPDAFLFEEEDEVQNLFEIFKDVPESVPRDVDNPEVKQLEPEKPAKLSFKSAEVSDIGGRENNEDSVLRLEGETSQGEPYGVYLVADGMGGEADGEAASKAVSDAVKAGIEVGIPQENLSEFVRNLLLEAKKKVAKGGTTATLALVIGDKAYIANVGDSRAYLVGVDGDFRRLTTDNSRVELFVEFGHMSRSETYASPVLNKLTHKLGQGEGAASFKDIKVSVVEGIKPGDKLLLCSDGVWGVIQDDSWEGSGDESGGRNSGALQQIVKDNSPQDAVEALIARVKAIGPEQRDDGTHRDLDNISAIVMEVARQETNGEQIDRLLAELDQESKDTEDGVAELEINYEESFESAHQRLQGRDDINWDDEESLQDKEIKIWSPIWAKKSLITNASVIKASAGDFEQFIFRHIVDKLVEKGKVINVDSFSGFDGIYELTVCSDIFEKDFEQLSEQYPDLTPDDILKNLFELYKKQLPKETLGTEAPAEPEHASNPEPTPEWMQDLQSSDEQEESKPQSTPEAPTKRKPPIRKW